MLPACCRGAGKRCAGGARTHRAAVAILRRRIKPAYPLHIRRISAFARPRFRRKWRKDRVQTLLLPFPGRQNDDYQTLKHYHAARAEDGAGWDPAPAGAAPGRDRTPSTRARSVTLSPYVLTLYVHPWHAPVVVGTVAMTVNQRQQRHRERKRAIAAGASALELRLRDLAVTDPAGAIAEWSEAVLKVPPGHPRAGEPMTLPPYAVSWLREALAPATRESAALPGEEEREERRAVRCWRLRACAGRCGVKGFVVPWCRSTWRKLVSWYGRHKRLRKPAGCR